MLLYSVYKLKIQLYFFRWVCLGLIILYQTLVFIIAIFLGHKSNKWVPVPSNRLYNTSMYRMKLLQLPVKGIRFYPIPLNCIRNINPVIPGMVRAFSNAPDSEFSTEEISIRLSQRMDGKLLKYPSTRQHIRNILQ